MERVAVFLDVNNLFFRLRPRGIPVRLDYRRWIRDLVGTDRQHVFTGAYYAALSQDYDQETAQDQQRMLDALTHADLAVMRKGKHLRRFIDLRKPGFAKAFGSSAVDEAIKQHGHLIPFYVEKGVDVHLAVDMVSMAFENKYDLAILVSGDSDFIPAVKVAQKAGKRVHNAFFAQDPPGQLRFECDPPFIRLFPSALKQYVLTKVR